MNLSGKLASNPSDVVLTDDAETTAATRRIRAVHVGISGFPFGSAAVNKCLAVYSSIHTLNTDVLIINNRAVHQKGKDTSIPKDGTIQGLRYTYTCPTPYRPTSFLKRNLNTLAGRLAEIYLLIRLGLAGRIDVLFYYPTNGSFFELIGYRILSQLFGFVLIAHYVEFRTAFSERINIIDKWKHRLYDRYFMRFTDAVLPISEFLIDHLKKSGYRRRLLKVPPLADFASFESAERQNNTPNFLYVGTAAYYNAISFITTAFDLADDSTFYLYLVVNGDTGDMQRIQKLVSEMKKRDRVRIFSKLPYSELLNLYKGATALLIPLSNSVTDVARFPQKISEYLASGNPIITTAYGEMPFYFTDGINALVAPEYTPESYAAKMNFVIHHGEEARDIGRNGHETGKRYFDINSYSVALKKMMISLLDQKK